ncbi:ABC transporter permease [Streptomyces cinnamoneus]|uniref:ABC transporter permease n=1 Tax=Streptomyces cinnamoneus TaxID=53446 RepID=UPI0034307D60
MTGPVARAVTPTGPGSWARDLAIGMRFAVTGGREGWLRTVLTAVGVGIGVALLLFMTAVPEALDARGRRAAARGDHGRVLADKASSATLLYREAHTEFRDRRGVGVLLRPEGPQAPVPPGVSALPRPGEMVVSPALAELLGSGEGTLLRERLPGRIVGTVGEQGLVGPDELVYYAGSDKLAVRNHTGAEPDEAVRISSFAGHDRGAAIRPELALLGGLACAVLLLPVGALIATAVRFGGERRDRRLAALRLVGADNRMTRRVAAGETLAGALLGLAVGAGLFLVARQFAPALTFERTGTFPSDLTPGAPAAVAIAAAVPVLAALVSLSALRHVAIEPLGVVREAPRSRRRLWWRLLLPAAGLALLVPLDGGGPSFAGSWMTGGSFAVGASGPAALGSALLLAGALALLPWLVEACVARLRGGPPAWQLATRRLQLDGSSASRAVSGIVVAVAGAISVQMVLAGTNVLSSLYEDDGRGQVVHLGQSVASGGDANAYVEKFRAVPGVRKAIGTVHVRGERDAPRGVVSLTVGDCDTLRELARVGSCKEGDAFVVTGAPGASPEGPRPGTELSLSRGGSQEKVRWTVPASARVVAPQDPRSIGRGMGGEGVLVTPSAIDVRGVPDASANVALRLDPSSPDAVERVRNVAAGIDPGMYVFTPGFVSQEEDTDFWVLLRALPAGAGLTLALIGASLLLATYEQLRERKRLLATLSAFGTRRSTVAWSVVWQTAVPVVLGMVLAVATGIGLGLVMLRAMSRGVRDWFAFVPVVGWGLGVIALVTVATLPVLWRMMRPEGLRAE